MSDISMDEIPMDVTIKAMQAQIDELKRIVATIHPAEKDQEQQQQPANAQELDELRQRVKELETANAKAEYRIQILLRALEQRDAIIKQHN